MCFGFCVMDPGSWRANSGFRTDSDSRISILTGRFGISKNVFCSRVIRLRISKNGFRSQRWIPEWRDLGLRTTNSDSEWRVLNPERWFQIPLHCATCSDLAGIECVFTKRGAAVDKLKRSTPMTLTSPFVTPVPVWICSNATSTIVRFASLPPHSVSGTTLLNKGQFNSRLQVVPTFAEK